jgi:N-hydroxyarylamine O-acetyltransferase
MAMFDAAAYLQRFGYDGPLTPSAETLRALQAAHLLTVPFENLDIHLHNSITLNEDALFAKIVNRRRGGFCYELNGLFAQLLRRLGFEVDLLAAAVAVDNGAFGPERDHLTLLVRLSDPWLVDVGFGDSFREPLALNESNLSHQHGDDFRFRRDGETWTLLRRRLGGPWEPQYRFTLQPHHLNDFEEMCHFQQTSPDSIFTRRRICSLATPDGRLTVSDSRLITTRGHQRVERVLGSEEEVRAVLRSYFGIDLDGRWEMAS